jgi:RNA polymerase sigma factor (sigma-70 family)
MRWGLAAAADMPLEFDGSKFELKAAEPNPKHGGVVRMGIPVRPPHFDLLNVTMTEDGETEWLDRLVDERPNQEWALAEADEMAQRRKLLGGAMTRLNERERVILSERRLRDEPLTLEDLSRRFHVSRERIRQLEVRAVEKLTKAMLGAAKTLSLPADLAAA